MMPPGLIQALRAARALSTEESVGVVVASVGTLGAGQWPPFVATFEIPRRWLAQTRAALPSMEADKQESMPSAMAVLLGFHLIRYDGREITEKQRKYLGFMIGSRPEPARLLPVDAYFVEICVDEGFTVQPFPEERVVVM